MITNMHIATEWRQFMLRRWARMDPNGRYVTVCGKRTQPKYIGIPGVTGQPAVVNGKAGWCPKCAGIVLGYIVNFHLSDAEKIQSAIVRNQLISLYHIVAGECRASLEAA